MKAMRIIWISAAVLMIGICGALIEHAICDMRVDPKPASIREDKCLWAIYRVERDGLIQYRVYFHKDKVMDFDTLSDAQHYVKSLPCD